MATDRAGLIRRSTLDALQAGQEEKSFPAGGIRNLDTQRAGGFNDNPMYWAGAFVENPNEFDVSIQDPQGNDGVWVFASTNLVNRFRHVIFDVPDLPDEGANVATHSSGSWMRAFGANFTSEDVSENGQTTVKITYFNVNVYFIVDYATTYRTQPFGIQIPHAAFVILPVGYNLADMQNPPPFMKVYHIAVLNADGCCQKVNTNVEIPARYTEPYAYNVGYGLRLHSGDVLSEIDFPLFSNGQDFQPDTGILPTLMNNAFARTVICWAGLPSDLTGVFLSKKPIDVFSHAGGSHVASRSTPSEDNPVFSFDPQNTEEHDNWADATEFVSYGWLTFNVAVSGVKNMWVSVGKPYVSNDYVLIGSSSQVPNAVTPWVIRMTGDSGIFSFENLIERGYNLYYAYGNVYNAGIFPQVTPASIPYPESGNTVYFNQYGRTMDVRMEDESASPGDNGRPVNIGDAQIAHAGVETYTRAVSIQIQYDLDSPNWPGQNPNWPGQNPNTDNPTADGEPITSDNPILGEYVEVNPCQDVENDAVQLNRMSVQEDREMNFVRTNGEGRLNCYTQLAYPLAGKEAGGGAGGWGIETREAPSSNSDIRELCLAGFEDELWQNRPFANQQGRHRVYGLAGTNRYPSGGNVGWGLMELEDIFRLDATNMRLYLDLSVYTNFKNISNENTTWDFNADANVAGYNGAKFDVVVDVVWDENTRKLTVKKRVITLSKFGLVAVSAVESGADQTILDKQGVVDIRFESPNLQKVMSPGGVWQTILGTTDCP